MTGTGRVFIWVTDCGHPSDVHSRGMTWYVDFYHCFGLFVERRHMHLACVCAVRLPIVLNVDCAVTNTVVCARYHTTCAHYGRYRDII